MRVTGKITQKRYKCDYCGTESLHSTNHYGKIYPRCRACGWKHPLLMNMSHTCLEPVPEEMGVPDEWPTVCLGDIVKIS